MGQAQLNEEMSYAEEKVEPSTYISLNIINDKVTVEYSSGKTYSQVSIPVEEFHEILLGLHNFCNLKRIEHKYKTLKYE